MPGPGGSVGSTQEKIATLIKQRGLIKGKLTRLINYVNSFDPEKDDHCEIKARSSELKSIMDNFETIQTQIEEWDTADGQELIQEDERSSMESKYYTIKGHMEKLLEESSGNLSQQFSSTINNPQDSVISKPRVKLPQLELPMFDGALKEWPTFKNLFMCAVNSANIPILQKFQYLKSSLKGEAAGLISSLLISEENYTKALQILTTRYENKTIIVNHHLKNFINHPTITKNNLKEYLVVLQQSLDSLNALGIPVNTWDVVIIFLITQKLDNSLRAAWEINRKDSKIPEIKELLDFLNLRVTAYELMNDRVIESPKHFFKPLQKVTHVTTTPTSVIPNVQCIMCQGQHYLFKCPTFLEYTVKRRIDFIKSHNLCYNCLQPFNNKHKCSSKRCFTCNGKHHTVIHMENPPRKVNTSMVTHSYTNQSLEQTPRILKPHSVQVHTNTNTPTDLKSNISISQSYPTQDSTHIDRHNTNMQSTSKQDSIQYIQNTHIDSNTTQSAVLFSNATTNHILLSTALIKIQDSAGCWHRARALLDSGSEVNLVTHRLARSLQCKFLPDFHIIQGVGDSSKQTQLCINTNIASNHSDYNINLNFIVMDNITVSLPHNFIDISSWNIPNKQLKHLADPKFYIPADIDILIGAQVFYSLLLSGRISLGNKHPQLIESVLGWIISGPLVVNIPSANNMQISLHLSTQPIEDVLVKFWNQEEITPKSIQTPEEKHCEKLFIDTIHQHNNGHFTVELPILKNRIQELGNSFNTAYRCLLQLEARFQKDPELYTIYKSFIDEYVTLGHAEYINNFQQSDTLPSYFLPHHPVIKPQSRTTKLRVVFNASAKTSTGTSLNDILLEGPNIYNDVLDIIIKFRMYKYVFSCDIIKMFRCIFIKPEQRALQRILWRESKSAPLKCLQLLTVTYGTKSAPYLACRTLRHLAEQNLHNYPLAANVITSDCYMDDCLSGADTIESVRETSKQLVELLDKGGFKLHKWTTNNSNTLDFLPKEQLSCNETYDLSPNNIIKTLGLQWVPSNDTIQIAIPDFKEIKYTKRNVLSTIAQIFDPLGILAPTTIIAKILMQDIWKLNIDWDKIITEDLKNTWLSFHKNLKYLQNIFIPRYHFSDIPKEITIIGFCDSSQKAYGACIYYRATYPNKHATCSLGIAKTRVAPLKTQSLPRLELCGGLLLAKLKDRVVKVLSKFTIHSIYLFTDSSILLHWIRSPYRKVHTYVSHRLMEIIELTDAKSWNYINTKENPADCLTRGIPPQDLQNHTIWWNGPKWLVEDPSNWPIANPPTVSETDYPVELGKAQRDQLVVTTTTKVSQPELNFYEFFHNHSNFTRLVRIMAYVLRFIHHTKNKTRSQTSHLLSLTDWKNAHNLIIRIIQQKRFPKEYTELQNLKSRKLQSTHPHTHTHPYTNSHTHQYTETQNLYTFKNSPLRKHNPFLDDDNIIRIGGRIQHADIPYNQAHPIILPSKDHITTLIVENYHLRLLHSGIQNTLANLRLRYWPLNGRNEVKGVIHRCVRCVRFRAQACEQQMANLPSPRVNLDRAFTHVGVDFSGAIYIRSAMTRNCKYVKGYICLFVCMSSKALHLELVTELTTQAFMCALKRFISRRGICSVIYSDNATNFKGAYNELNELYKMFHSKESYSQIGNYCNINNIKWKFTIPLASHMGGLYESGIKSVKTLLKKHLCNVKLTYELLYTVLVQIEGILNSRPMCTLTDVPNDIACLTPAHFIIGAPITDLPEPSVLNLLENRLSLYQKLTQMKQKFWSQFYKNYLSELQPRSKWLQIKSNLNKGDIVILKEECTPPACWPLGKIVSVNKNKHDNLVRSVVIRTAKGEYTRPINKIVLLPVK